MYPSGRAARDRFVLERRGPLEPYDPWLYQDLVVEDELTDRRTLARTATVFLTGKECAWRCVMCDLWRHTTPTDTPPGAIPAQVAAARNALESRGERIAQMKLYNASNFFDPHAVPERDYPAIAAALTGLDRVVVESHPALIGERVDRLLRALDAMDALKPPALEVAMGLETANPDALERLNKALTLEDFSSAAVALGNRGVDLRVFLLVGPPFIEPRDQDGWLMASVDRACSCGATAISLIPTRAGNGAMEELASDGLYRAPDLADVERSLDLALIHARRARVFVDLWDLQRLSRCAHCFDARRKRLETINLQQRSPAAITCARCGHGRWA
jgi:hypothetical protein